MMFDAISLCLLLMSRCHSFQTCVTLHISKFSTGAEVLNQFQSDWEENTVREDLLIDPMPIEMRSNIQFNREQNDVTEEKSE
jgi:hypothetical protein